MPTPALPGDAASHRYIQTLTPPDKGVLLIGKFSCYIFCAFPFPSSPLILPTSPPTQLHALPFLKKKQANVFKKQSVLLKSKNSKIKNVHTKQYETKVCKTAIEFVLLTAYSWAWVYTQVWITIPSETPAERAIFAFVSGYQLQIPSWFGVGTSVHFVLSAPRPHLAWTCAGPVHAAVSLSLCVHQSCCVRSTLCLWSHLSALALSKLFASSSA